MITALAFDLGDTLVEYEGMPLSWEAHYAEALGHLATSLGVAPTAGQIDQGCAVLRRYNTRLHPREIEFPFAAILSELARCFHCPPPPDKLAAAKSFFQIFRQRLRCFPETKATLATLRAQGHKIGVFTDVPYGMPRALVMEDIAEAGLRASFDILLTSLDVGFRKPSIATLTALARQLGCTAQEMTYIGNERKDVEVARAFGCASILIDRPGHGSDWGQSRTISSLSELL